jgi:hypothetical protein
MGAHSNPGQRQPEGGPAAHLALPSFSTQANHSENKENFTMRTKSHRYSQPLADLQSGLARVSRGELPIAQCGSLFRMLMGAVQQVLDQASEDLGANYRQLHHQRTANSLVAGKQVTDFVTDFGDIQDDMHASVKQIGQVFADCDSLQELNLRLPILDSHITSLQASIDALDRLSWESSDARLAQLPAPPLPDQVSRALDHYDVAVKSLIRFMEAGRDIKEIQQCVLASDAAKLELLELIGASHAGH